MFEHHGKCIASRKNHPFAILSSVKFFPFEARLNLGHVGIHNAINFEDIMGDITSKALAFSIEKGRHNFDTVTDVNGLNSHIFSFFDVMHLTYSEKIGNGDEENSDDANQESQAYNHNIRMSNLGSFKEGLERNVLGAASSLTDSIVSASTSINQTVSSALKLKHVGNLL